MYKNINISNNNYVTIRNEIYEDSLKLSKKIQEARKYEEEFFLKLLCGYYNAIINTENLKADRNCFVLNKHSLAISIKSMLDDIDRFEIYSHSKTTERPKFSAYIVRWISKIKPIQIINQDVNSVHLHFINSYFAIFAGVSLLELNDYESKQSIKIYEELRYATYYRDISPKELTLLFRVLKNIDSDRK